MGTKEVPTHGVRLPQESILARAEADPVLAQIEGYLDRYTTGVWWRPGWDNPRAVYAKSDDSVCIMDILHTDPKRQWHIQFNGPEGHEDFKRFRDGQWIYFPSDYDPENDDENHDNPDIKTLKPLLLRKLTDFFGESNNPILPNHYIGSSKPPKVQEPDFLIRILGRNPTEYQRYPGFKSYREGDTQEDASDPEARIKTAAASMAEEFDIDPARARTILSAVVSMRGLSIDTGTIRRVLAKKLHSDVVDKDDNEMKALNSLLMSDPE